MTEDVYWSICSKYNIHFYPKPNKEELEKLDVDEFEEQLKQLVTTLSKRGDT